MGEQLGPLCQAQQEPLSLSREQAGLACPSWALWLGAAGAVLNLSPQNVGQPCQDCLQEPGPRLSPAWDGQGVLPPGRFGAEAVR